MEEIKLKDVQKSKDIRGIFINKVGIEDVTIFIRNVGKVKASLQVPLSQDRKGTHMSRLNLAIIRVADALNNIDVIHSNDIITLILVQLRNSLGEPDGDIILQLNIDSAVAKKSPLKNNLGFRDLKYSIVFTLNSNNLLKTKINQEFLISTLCPCSKEISDYGAHNQRAKAEFSYELDLNKFKDARDLDTGILIPILNIVEKSGSAPLYPILKREEEKYVTELAYENPKFVEDVARDLFIGLMDFKGIILDRVKVTSYESIHEHNAVAEIINNKMQNQNSKIKQSTEIPKSDNVEILEDKLKINVNDIHELIIKNIIKNLNNESQRI